MPLFRAALYRTLHGNWHRYRGNLMASFSIPVIEYCSTNRKPGAGSSLPACVFNDRQLTIGMVRSILTLNPGRTARRFMAAIVRPTLLFILDWNRTPVLSLNPNFQNLVRDFSTTTRVGELAQAVCYCYWHWHAGYSFVADFTSYAKGHGFLLPSGSKIPDYIMFNMTTGVVALMEAKGTQGRNHASQMAGALRQIREARPFTPANRGIGCVLALDHPSGSATLHLRDPENEIKITDSIKHDVFRSSYAAWFDLAGMEEMSDWCRTPLIKSGNMNQNYFKSLIERKSDTVDPLQKVVAEALGFNPNRVTFHLNPCVIEALGSVDAFKSFTHNMMGEASSAESSMSPGSKILFPDGTAILPE